MSIVVMAHVLGSMCKTDPTLGNPDRPDRQPLNKASKEPITPRHAATTRNQQYQVRKDGQTIMVATNLETITSLPPAPDACEPSQHHQFSWAIRKECICAVH